MRERSASASSILSPLDVILSDRPAETTVLQPDIIYIDPQRLEALHMRGVEGPPPCHHSPLSVSCRLRSGLSSPSGRKPRSVSSIHRVASLTGQRV